MTMLALALGGLAVLALVILGVLWLVTRGSPAPAPTAAPRPAATPATVPAASPAVSRPFTAADAHAIYRHFLATIGWVAFWFSATGGAAAALVINGTDNRLDYPLAIVAVACWGTLGAAVAFASRADLRKLGR